MGSSAAEPRRLERRDFLRLSGQALLGAGAAATIGDLAGCTSKSPQVGPSSMRPTIAPPSARPEPPTGADWAALGRSLDGDLIRPGDPGYSTARLSFNPRFDGSRPAGVAFCASPADVQRSVAFAREHGTPIAPRAGGHSYAGYSTTAGLVCDVTRLAQVSVSGSRRAATVGGGARLIDVYAALARYGVALPAGSCPTVGVAGLALGGGVGVIARKFGLTSDNVRSVQIVTGGGELLTCDGNRNEDLLWACRGGGGGNFGVVTSFTFDVHPVTELTLFSLSWAWASASDVLSAWQDWAPHAPDELWSTCHLLSTTTGTDPTVSTPGVFLGTPGALAPFLSELQGKAGVSPVSTSVNTHSYLEAMLIEGGCYGRSVDQCHLAIQGAGGTLEREASRARSDFFTRPLDPTAVRAVVGSVEERQSDPRTRRIGGVVLDALGGAVNRVAPDATAFAHRDALFLGQYVATWPPGSPADVTGANAAWLNRLYASLRPAASGSAYQNYIDPDLHGWEHAYYGDNLSRLIAVKRAYDPDNVFDFAQGIPVS